jgi:hypothetical protein
MMKPGNVTRNERNENDGKKSMLSEHKRVMSTKSLQEDATSMGNTRISKKEQSPNRSRMEVLKERFAVQH